MLHPEVAKTLAEQRREELTRYTAESRQARQAGPGWLGRHLPRWYVRGSSPAFTISAYR